MAATDSASSSVSSPLIAEYQYSTAIFPPATSEATYSISRFDFTKATEADNAQIGELYKALFATIGLVFDPAIDSDFVHPRDYFTTIPAAKDPSVNGAYFVARRHEPSSGASYIVGTLGVRAYQFGSKTLFDTCINGVSNAGVKSQLLELATTQRDGSAENVQDIEIISSQDICEFKRMIVHSECRGKGLGKLLVKVALEWSYATAGTPATVDGDCGQQLPFGGFRAALLDTNRRLSAANYLYETFGFVDCGNYNDSYRADRFMVSVKK